MIFQLVQYADFLMLFMTMEANLISDSRLVCKYAKQ